MDILARLETAVDVLLNKNRQLQIDNSQLREKLEHLTQERHRLVEEIDRILKRLEDI